MKKNTMNSVIVIKMRESTNIKLKKLVELMNKNIVIGKITQLEALDHAVSEAITALKNGK